MDVAAYMKTPPQLADRPDAEPLSALLGEVTFEHVRFGYESLGASLYRDFSLTIRPGERIALVGPGEVIGESACTKT